MSLKSLIRTALTVLAGSFIMSCNEMTIDIPKGIDGKDGMTAYQTWKTAVQSGTLEWPINKVEVTDYIAYIKGEKGENGKSAYELWKVLISTGTVADPHNPSVNWDPSKNTEADFWNFLTGRDGDTPHIGSNGNWFIGSSDTGVKAVGKDGKNGKDGLDGLDGQTAYELWKELVAAGTVDWPKDKTTQVDFYTYLKGKDGENGLTPHVGTNGNWFVGAVDTGVPAKGEKGDSGKDGADGTVPHVGENGNWWIGGEDTGVPAKGETGSAGADGQDGTVPHVGDNGHWYVGTVDTGIPAKGATGPGGADGASGGVGSSPYVGSNGNWYVGTTDTGVPAKGEKGDKGDAGADGADGETPVVIDGIWWVGTTDTGIPAKGQTGDKGAAGSTGSDGADGNIPYVQDGYWYIGGTSTGVPAKGEKGDAGSNGNDGAAGADGKDGKDGKDGVSPHIGDNGNWYIGTTDTGVPASVGDGTAGATAYELWCKDLAEGLIKDKEGNAWPTEKNTVADFYEFLKGASGADGEDGKDGNPGSDGQDAKSAYEVWKEQIKTGTVDDPKNPGQKWPASKDTENDFYYFLSGEDGKDGSDAVNGLSAYELWKDELASRDGTEDPIWDRVNETPWDPAKNTMEDYLLFIKGAKGMDGKDGKPGKPGEPGAIVTIVKGVPNVIAQYSQSEYGEYVRTTDGGVLYKVYDKKGKLAPGAMVSGLPGIDAGKSYISDANGEFIIPREDLPSEPVLENHWGTVDYVTINGETAESAQNTYVPNKVELRLVAAPRDPRVFGSFISYYVSLQRQLDPGAEWEYLPMYLPLVGAHPGIKVEAVKLKSNADVTDYDETFACNQSTGSYKSVVGNVECLSIEMDRFVLSNPFKEKNRQPAFHDGNEMYFSARTITQYYGTTATWKGWFNLPAAQAAPSPSTIKLTTVSTTEEVYFLRSEGVFDYSTVDMTRVYTKEPVVTRNPGGLESIEFVPDPEDEAKNRKDIFCSFVYKSKQGDQTSDNKSHRSSFASPAFSTPLPYLNSDVYSSSNNLYGLLYNPFIQVKLGKLVQDVDGGYKIEKADSDFPDITVTYVP